MNINLDLKKEKKCPDHPSYPTKLELNPEGSAHYGKIYCSYCFKFIQHAPHPRKDSEFSQRQAIIRNIVTSKHLSEKEKTFLQNIYCKRSLTPKQKDYYIGIRLKLESCCCEII